MLNVNKLRKFGVYFERHHLIILPKIIRMCLRVFYCCDIPISDKIANTVHFNHNGFGIVINSGTEIHDYCDIQHSVTIGIKYGTEKAPVIEDYVTIGARSVIIGPITIGHHAIIGASAVVVKDVPPYAVVVGNPAQIIKYNKTDI